MSDRLSPKAVEALLAGVCATIHAIDGGERHSPISSKGQFLHILQAYLEHIGSHSELAEDDLADFHRLAGDLLEMARTREFPEPENFL